MRRPFFDTLRDVRGGQVIDDLAEQMQELVRAVEATGKAGTLTLEVKPFKGAAEAAVVVKDTIKLRLPKHESAGTVLFATVDGNLQRNHPAQDELPGISLAAASH